MPTTQQPAAESTPDSMFQPNALDSMSAAEQIAEQLRAAMIDGSLKPGDRLPSEPELAEGFGVSRPTVREAMKILRGQGVLRTSRGAKGGHFVHHPQTQDIAESLGETYCLWFDIGDISVAEVDEAREVVERACVQLAAMRRTHEDIAKMGRLLDSASQSELSIEDFLQLEVEFHQAIAVAAKNRLLNLPMQAIHMVRPRTNRLLKRHNRESILEQHVALYEAIAKGDPQEAETAFNNHLSHLADLRQRAARSRHKDTSEIPLSELKKTDAETSPPTAPGS